MSEKQIKRRRLGPTTGRTPSIDEFRRAIHKAHQESVKTIAEQRKQWKNDGQ